MQSLCHNNLLSYKDEACRVEVKAFREGRAFSRVILKFWGICIVFTSTELHPDTLFF